MMKEAILRFIQNVSQIQELDYGDFMRKANHYLIDLENQPDAGNLVADMKLHLQYRPNWNIESTKDYILKEAEHAIGFN